nr:MFS transporter [Cellulomonas wangleii]
MPSAYSDVLRLPGVARLFLIGLVARVPHAMSGVVLTLHVVGALDEGYGRAGVVAASLTVGLAVGAPWRGRLVDRLGLRRAVLPSVAVESAVWLSAPHLDYIGLIAVVFVGGLFLVPVFSVVRQSLSVLVPPAQQKAAFALDSVATELTFMLGPVLGVLLVTGGSSVLALTVVGVATVGGGALLLWADPPTRSASGAATPADRPAGRVVTPRLLVVLLAAVAAAFVIVGTDVSLVAALNDAGRPQDVGWMVALWAGGSLVGGLLHGISPRQPAPLVLVALLALATLPAAFADGRGALAVAVVIAGLPCAPVLASINATLVRLVPEERRGEVMGWGGTMQTVGNALGAPLCGVVIDRAGAGAGFATAAVVGGAVAVVGLVVVALAGRRRAHGGGVPVVTDVVTAPVRDLREDPAGR